MVINVADDHLAIQDDRRHGYNHGKLGNSGDERTAFSDIGPAAKEHN